MDWLNWDGKHQDKKKHVHLGKALDREVKLARAQSVKSVRDEGYRTAPRFVVSSTPDLRKLPKELTVSPQDTAAKKPEMKRPKASPREEEWMKLRARKSLRKEKPKPEAEKPDWPRRARSEAVLINPTEGVSYAAILMKINRCYCFLGFSHMAANCQGPDRSRSCWRCGEEGHAAGSCTRKPQCYLCSAKDKPRDDHIPGTIRCAVFREAASKKKLLRGRIWSQAGSR